MVSYVFNDDPRLLHLNNARKLDAQKIGEMLEKLPDRTPTAIVEAASNRRNPAHNAFEWDDEIAGAKFRLDQARTLCQVIRIESEEIEDETSPAFVSVQSDTGRRYFTRSELVGSADLQLRVLKQAKRDLVSFKTRYAELEDICSDVAEAIRKIDGRLDDGEGGDDRPTA